MLPRFAFIRLNRRAYVAADSIADGAIHFLSSVLQHSPCMCRESFILLSMDRHSDLQACRRGPMEELSRRIERPSMFDAHSVRVSSAVQLVKAECDAPVRRCTTYRSHMHAFSSAPPVHCSKQLLNARSHTPWRERRVVCARAHASMAQVLDDCDYTSDLQCASARIAILVPSHKLVTAAVASPRLSSSGLCNAPSRNGTRSCPSPWRTCSRT